VQGHPTVQVIHSYVQLLSRTVYYVTNAFVIILSGIQHISLHYIRNYS